MLLKSEHRLFRYSSIYHNPLLLNTKKQFLTTEYKLRHIGQFGQGQLKSFYNRLDPAYHYVDSDSLFFFLMPYDISHEW